MHYRNDLTEVADLVQKVSGVEVTNLSTNKQSLSPPKSRDSFYTEAKTAVRGGYVCVCVCVRVCVCAWCVCI